MKQTSSWIALIALLWVQPAIAQSNRMEQASEPTLTGQVTSVNQLADVRSTDWAFEALRSLIERYGCITGDAGRAALPEAERTFRGNRALTRYEFAAGLNACLNRMAELIASSTANVVSFDDRTRLERLQQEFAAELSTLRGRIDSLEARTTQLEKQQFSTTTKLRGQIIMAPNAGGFEGEQIVDAQGRRITEQQPNATVLSRVALDLNTSFTGTDSLRVLLETGSGGRTTNATGFLEPTFGSVLDFSVKPPTRGTLEMGRLVYSFNPTSDLRVSIGPEIRTSDYVDRNRYANVSFRDFSTQAFVNNLLLLSTDGPSAGGAINWNPGGGAFSLRAVYSAVDAANPSNQGIIRGGASFLPLLYASQGGDRGIFGDTYQYTAEFEYAPSRAFAVRLQYAGGEVYNNRFDVFGVNFEYQIAPNLAVFGRYGSGSYDRTIFGKINPHYWMAGVAFPDVLRPGNLAGIAVGQPFIADEIGNATQTNFEAFVSIPINHNIRVTPLLQVVTSAGNQNSNGTIFTGTLRTVFSF
ncbi:iron uptake porin [Leptolyngbya sp. NIES-2104]|uniref:iron uptake porin n=1 Tax=Leptolyngbya sp. NIES-2104 TaxID=1552121 RepID=UPI0006EC46B2|nr:iron uptake porin [Leptolyngbya sp. NIES-2104]GAP99995.1 major outer membrane protein [Leptolyngbya sp. NIES-2104]